MQKMDIIYEDKKLLVINKPTKLLTISDGKTDHTLYSMVSSYVKKQHKSNKIFIVHRLDKDTSGIVIFAKDEKTKYILQNNWNNNTKREYIAVLDGILEKKSGILKDYLYEDKARFVHVSNSKKGELAITEYEVLKYKDNKTIVKINIKTGKKNQIRVSFSNINHPILGDKKYGTNKEKRLYLHASKLYLTFENKKYIFEAKLPNEFKKYI